MLFSKYLDLFAPSDSRFFISCIQSWEVTDYMSSGLRNQIPKIKYL